MQPFLDARFTQGALDGGERGSGRGLAQLLDELIAYVEEVCWMLSGGRGVVVRTRFQKQAHLAQIMIYISTDRAYSLFLACLVGRIQPRKNMCYLL